MDQVAMPVMLNPTRDTFAIAELIGSFDADHDGKVFPRVRQPGFKGLWFAGHLCGQAIVCEGWRVCPACDDIT